jgi:DNA-directed RNA polymerase sigma subunit (sigma70/sigma32)
MEYKVDREVRLQKAVSLHQDWIVKRREAEQAKARMVLALYDAYTSGYTMQELADMVGVSRQRMGQYLDGPRT